MIVSRKSWHSRLYTFMQPDECRYWTSVSACEYWGRIVTSPIFFATVVIAFPVFGIIALADKLVKKVGKKVSCPFGKVERK